MEYAESVFQIILYGGNARSSAIEAIRFAKQGNFTAAREALDQAAKDFQQAHQIQTSLIQREASGEKTEATLLMIHAQDHLMNAITVRDLAVEFVELYETIFRQGGVRG
ncbi:PTS lactose/cellobiose transporter subunit IIA [Brevibacillus sp. SYP-B805]|uniref:PTS lactose/cellobiose transporter subunit IIA n=1 Tax=Brevibacillus sp. SYP-B805 TaxID=1578199 RepID=UPI0013EB813A|nr:PTS lactose/cellobiose transporter subunit IIA [Brevibacillus sp. SYP-B805]NGQ97347.1 PTS lactose/cellobiose transporter subunit IIA [Brevibacillus sp. SYP-B805]